jgi:hypothetical protein
MKLLVGKIWMMRRRSKEIGWKRVPDLRSSMLNRAVR